MKITRPKSAKLGTKIEYHDQTSQISHQNQSEFEEQQQNYNKKVISNKQRLLSANYKKFDRKGIDFGSKVLPKYIPQDKERLYQESIKLKQQMNSVDQENIKLRTKLIKLQRENQKLQKAMQVQDQFVQRPKSRVHSGIISQAQSSKIAAMKRLVRESKDEVQFLKAQNQKLKKSAKYTRLTELENENKSLIEEMTKMGAIIDQLTEQQKEIQYHKKVVQEMDRFLKVKLQQNQQLQQKNRQLQDEVYEIQEQNKTNFQKTQQKERKLLRDLQFSKRKSELAQKQITNLKNQLNKIKNQKVDSQNVNNAQKKQFSRNNRNPNIKTTSVPNSNFPSNQKLVEQMVTLKKRNEQLQKQNVELTSTIKSQEQKLILTEREDQNKSKIQKDTKQNGIASKQQIVDDYDEDFEVEEQQSKQKSEIKKNSNIKNELLQQQDHDGQEQQILYQEEDQNSKQKQKPKSAKKGVPKKKALKDLKLLLTYRMKAQRYTIAELTEFITSTLGEKVFISDIISFLHDQPFLLNDKQVKLIIKLISPEEFKNPQSTVPRDTVTNVVLSSIQKFQLKDQNQDQQMFMQIAQMVTTYITQLQQMFEQFKNPGQDYTVTEKTLRKLFKEKGLQQKYIDFIVSELSMYSQDLQHLDYNDFLARFFITNEDGVEQLDEQYENQSRPFNQIGRIDEQQIQQSQDSKSKSKLKKLGKK